MFKGGARDVLEIERVQCHVGAHRLYGSGGSLARKASGTFPFQVRAMIAQVSARACRIKPRLHGGPGRRVDYFTIALAFISVGEKA